MENIEGILVFVAAERISPLYIKYSFRLKSGDTLPFKAGQYLDLVFHYNGIPEKRSYSIASPPHNGLIDFVIRDIKHGVAGSKLNSLQKGDTISFYGPFGRLNISDWQEKLYILIATGSGIAPFRSMLADIEANLLSGETEIILLLGIGEKEDAPFLEEFLESSSRHDGFKLFICYGANSNKGQEAWECNLDVEDKLMQVFETNRPHKILISSSPNLINKARTLLTSLGFSNDDILSDI